MYIPSKYLCIGINFMTSLIYIIYTYVASFLKNIKFFKAIQNILQL